MEIERKYPERKNRRKADSETPLSDPACPQIYDRIRCV